MKKNQISKGQTADPWRFESEAANAKRAMLTASLKEQRLKRDAEIVAASPPAELQTSSRRKKAS